jgi:hypothetical protein
MHQPKEKEEQKIIAPAPSGARNSKFLTKNFTKMEKPKSKRGRLGFGEETKNIAVPVSLIPAVQKMKDELMAKRRKEAMETVKVNRKK